MSEDLIERLRYNANLHVPDPKRLFREAADEIERLRAALVAVLDFEQDVYVKDKEVILYMKNTAKQGLEK
jgi:hypothetical protein